MSNEYITIQEAADLSNKSIQTIRRAIKSKKIEIKKKKTPQGFNYLIVRDSLFSFYGLKIETKSEEVSENVKEKKVQTNENSMTIAIEDFKAFAQTMEKLISQHNEERKSFLTLINSLQEKIFVMENQINLLKAPVDRRWFQFWKSKV